MKSATLCSAVLLLLLTPFCDAQTRRDEEALRDLPRQFCEAWAQHDGRALARMMADDVDFVTVGATMFRGRSDFEKYHTRLLEGRFRESTNTLLDTSVRFVRRDLAIVHWTWSIEGDKNPDQSMRPRRFGLMTMIAEKRKGRWSVLAAQNTNAAPTPSPEASDIKSPLVFPRRAP